MIAHLSGSVIHSEKNYLILQAGAVGYKVFVTEETRQHLRGESVSLWIYSAIREDAFDLFGFIDRNALAFFELLITVPGIGPKTALGILSLADVATIQQAVVSGDTSYLTKVSGIGKKTADKIVLELEGKLGHLQKNDMSGTAGDVDVIEALRAIGFEEREARQALQKIPEGIKDIGERVKAALRILGK